MLGEGACALVIAAAAVARRRGARSYARVAGFANRAAGRSREYRHDAPDLDVAPAVRALLGAVADAGWRTDQIDLVNDNGSSSKLYDVLEARAVQAACGTELAAHLPIHSVKAALGQHGAGSAAFQAVTACLSLATGMVPPTINCDHVDERCGALPVVTTATHLSPARVLVNAIGFGGFYYSALALERVADAVDGRPRPEVRWSVETERLGPI